MRTHDSPPEPDSASPVALDPVLVARFRRQIADKGVPISKTAVGEYLKCPARWALKTIERQGGGPVRQELRLGRACHKVVAEVLLGDKATGRETSVAEALQAQGIATHMLPSATDWVLWAVDLTRQRHGCVVAVEQTVRAHPLAGVTLSGRFDLVISDGNLAPLELLDWGFGRHPRFCRAEEMLVDVGTAIYRTLLAVSMPNLPDRVVISDVHVPGRQVLSVELARDDVLRAWRDIEAVRDGMRAVAELGQVEAKPGHHCNWCSLQWRCPYSPASLGAA
jgi:PD-(D/E)XK nuclease superfamily